MLYPGQHDTIKTMGPMSNQRLKRSGQHKVPVIPAVDRFVLSVNMAIDAPSSIMVFG